jgi:hypothetical protein
MGEVGQRGLRWMDDHFLGIYSTVPYFYGTLMQAYSTYSDNVPFSLRAFASCALLPGTICRTNSQLRVLVCIADCNQEAYFGEH